MKTAVSVLEPFPPPDSEEERGREREDRKDRDQLRAEEQGNHPELSDFFCSLFL